jgi:hypothetical protein
MIMRIDIHHRGAISMSSLKYIIAAKEKDIFNMTNELETLRSELCQEGERYA